MAKYYFEKNGKRNFIKKIDYAEGKLIFTENVDEAFNDRDGYYANATRDMIRRGFKEEYPEVENLQCYNAY